jgi:hypothetical protein
MNPGGAQTNGTRSFLQIGLLSFGKARHILPDVLRAKALPLIIKKHSSNSGDFLL